MIFKTPPPSNGNSRQESKSETHLRLKDGDVVNIIPRGEIYEFYSVFGTKGEVSADTPSARARFKVNVVIFENGMFKAKILEFGKSIYSQLYELNHVCDVTQTKLRFSRKGSTKDTTEYTLLPIIKEPLSAGQMDAIRAVDLHILGVSSQPSEPLPPPSEHGPNWDRF